MAIGVAAAAVGLVGVAFVLSSRRDMTPERARGSAMLPGLEARAAEVGAVEVLRGNATVRLDRGADGSWVLVGNDGYPARGELVRAMLVSVAGLTVDDRMTAKRDRHSELGLAVRLNDEAENLAGARLHDRDAERLALEHRLQLILLFAPTAVLGPSQFVSQPRTLA
jgi:hypothetical protein